jgi:hypothetical protein
MKTIITLLLITTSTFASVEKVCEAYGQFVQREMKKELLSRKVNETTALWYARCTNGYMQGVCISRKGDFKSIESSKFQDATKYCISLAKKSK